MIQTLEALITRLTEHTEVIGLVRYGRRQYTDNAPGSDFDLFVFLEDRPVDVESLHFHVGDIPVDMSVRTLADLQRESPISPIDYVLMDGEVLYDPSGIIDHELAALPERWPSPAVDLTEHERTMNRFSQQHVLDKVRHRLDDEPVFCAWLMATNIYWLVQTYFRVREIPYPGERLALQWLEENEPDMYLGIEHFFQTNNLADQFNITERLTDYVMLPIGGPWRQGEVLAFGTNTQVKGLQEQGQRLFERLLR